MSYILDALKRADAERERGHVPGLHAQSIDSVTSTGRRAGLPRWALAAGGGSALVVVAALAWRMGADAHAPLPTPLTAPEPAPAPVVVAAAPAAEPPAAPVIEAAPPPPIPAPPPVAYVAPPPPAAKPVREAKPPPAPRPTPAAAPTAAPVRAPEPAPPATVPLLAELPGTLRQQLPNLAVTGSVYSEDAASRFIMLNGEVVKEGGQPAPGLVLERIEPKSAVLRYKGQRFRLPY